MGSPLHLRDNEMSIQDGNMGVKVIRPTNAQIEVTNSQKTLDIAAKRSPEVI